MSKYVIIDLEMCHVSKGEQNLFSLKSELIQIGAVLVGEDLKIAESFKTYVAPKFGKINTYIEKLTGISQKDVQNAPDFKKALELFVQWLPSDAILVSWSENDEKQIRNELEAKNIVIEGLLPYLDKWVDCQKSFSEKINAEKNYKLAEALNICSIDYDKGEHDALVDAKNTARLFIKMQKEPELILSPYYASDSKNLTFSLVASILDNCNLVG